MTPPDIDIPDTDDALLAECEVQTFRAGGPGGQHQNTTESAVRLVHEPTGVAVTCREERSQHRNKAICLARLRERLQEMNEPEPERVPTRTPRTQKAKRVERKRKRSRRKELRKKPPIPPPDEY
jgi:protein subunit release factor A